RLAVVWRVISGLNLDQFFVVSAHRRCSILQPKWGTPEYPSIPAFLPGQSGVHVLVQAIFGPEAEPAQQTAAFWAVGLAFLHRSTGETSMLNTEEPILLKPQRGAPMHVDAPRLPVTSQAAAKSRVRILYKRGMPFDTAELNRKTDRLICGNVPLIQAQPAVIAAVCPGQPSPSARRVA
ncbi:MAG: hypothetical protein LBH68_06610, partial [Bifidobacteriaceae bacterium]|nr:hypothetical protein [Bifidobacteriaceae bacterium]